MAQVEADNDQSPTPSQIGCKVWFTVSESALPSNPLGIEEFPQRSSPRCQHFLPSLGPFLAA